MLGPVVGSRSSPYPGRLLRQHQQHVRAQIAELTECLNLITFKIRLYEACRAEGLADPLLTAEEDLGAH
jgi:hypothetical protein